ncbi:MAG: amino acid ABC transporter substrate-binding protein [Desulfobulbaceae bacterium]|nr:MAG: amino acid ABC transporter substrate-binding protein [Desulfobulbaceae bacterium]
MKSLAGLLVIFILIIGLSAQAGTLDEVKERDELICGTSGGKNGFSRSDGKGNWSGLDVDFCRAVAAAVLSDARKVKFVVLPEQELITALISGNVDLLPGSSLLTQVRDTALAVRFVGVSYYDGQGFMLSKKLAARSILELEGAEVCVQRETLMEQNLDMFFKRNKIPFESVPFNTLDQAILGFTEGRCDAVTLEQSKLHDLRLNLGDQEGVRVLPGVISKLPLGPVVRRGDENWFSIIRWCLFALLQAEEYDISSGNFEVMKQNSNPHVRILLGLDESTGTGMGLAQDWALNIIKQVGNYSEIFERNLGQGSELKIGRGINGLWNQGGIHYAPPFH